MSEPPRTPQLPAERYRQAAALCEWNVRKRVRNVTVTPHWIGGSERFWYERQTPDGSQPILVDAASGRVDVLPEPPAAPDGPPSGTVRSPDGRWDLHGADANLFVPPAGDAAPRRLTGDGTPHNGYGLSAGSSLAAVTMRRSDIPPHPSHCGLRTRRGSSPTASTSGRSGDRRPHMTTVTRPC